MATVQADFPEKLRCLFDTCRYKVLRGGRGSGKSWGVARALLILGVQRPLRVLCTREVQQSIRESVHKLLSEQIANLQLGAFFEIEKQSIRGKNGTEFVFAGLSDQTAESIKSFEGADVCWVEEAQVVTDRSWTILTPTIRKDGSEIWVTYNPELDTDATHVRFVENPPPELISVEMNWRDNPWFNDVMEKERMHAFRTLPAIDYENIWEGKCRPAASGAIYALEVAQMFAEHRVTDVPYDPFLVVHPVFDLGWNDHMSIGLVQRHISSLRIIDYIEDDHKTLDWYSKELRKREYSWGRIFLPHDGGHGDYKTGKSAAQILEDLKWQVEVLPRQPITDGIREARMAFAQLAIDKAKASRLVECLKRYRRNVSNATGEAGNPIHDEWSHGADMYRYVAQAAPLMDNFTGMTLPKLRYGSLGIV
ncbi:MAG: PBSX family phage terminase large subunit [Terriglobia bacterium]|nr:PBSX family phage terminase large subunit [Terriglobia bacterium]